MSRWLDAVSFGPQRRARRMMRQLRKLDEQDARLRAAGLDPLDEWRRSRDPRLDPIGASPRPARSSRRAALLAAVLTASVGGLVAWHQYHGGAADGPPAAARPANLPPAGIDEQADRIGQPAPAPSGAGGFVFEHSQPDGSPVAWDPCRPIHYVVSGTAPVGAADVVDSALAEVTRLTGFRFVADGATDETARADRAPYQPDRYGHRWAPVLIAWTTPADVPKLAGATIGLGGADGVRWGGSDSTYVSGIVYLDKPQFDAELAQAPRGRHARAELRAVVLHEVGHLLGLAHVTDPNAIMYPESQLSVTDYSAGDLRGLHALAEGHCAPQL